MTSDLMVPVRASILTFYMFPKPEVFTSSTPLSSLVLKSFKEISFTFTLYPTEVASNINLLTPYLKTYSSTAVSFKIELSLFETWTSFFDFKNSILMSWLLLLSSKDIFQPSWFASLISISTSTNASSLMRPSENVKTYPLETEDYMFVFKIFVNEF